MMLLRIIVFLLVGSIAMAELTCDRDEVIDNCPVDCPYDYCPEYEHQDKIACPKPKECPPAKCKCGFNYRKAKNGTCIPTTECPPFKCTRQNEEYQSCPSYCPSDDCGDASALGGCPYWLLIVVYCSPQCKCIDGYWRKDGVCVPYNECRTQYGGEEGGHSKPLRNLVVQESAVAKTTGIPSTGRYR